MDGNERPGFDNIYWRPDDRAGGFTLNVYNNSSQTTNRMTGIKMARYSIALLSLALFTATQAAPAPTGQFNVLTFNVAGLPQILQPNGQKGDKKVNTAAIGTTFGARKEEFDIIHVQEDFNYHSTLYQYDTHAYRTATSGGAGFGSGLNTLSNYNWIAFDRVKWGKCNGIFDQDNDCLTPKGFTFMRVRLDEGVYVDCYNVHADAGTTNDDHAARKANIQQVADYISTNSAGHAVIVFGDTNTRYTRALDTIRVLSSPPASLTDAWVQLQKNGNPPPAGSEAVVCGNPAQTDDCEIVDKVLYRGGPLVNLQATQVAYASQFFLTPAGDTMSDHNPVLVNFTYSLPETLRQSEYLGGASGVWFNDVTALPATGSPAPKITSVTLRGGSRLDSLAFTLSTGQTLAHGGTGGAEKTLVLDSGEVLSSAQICQGTKSGDVRIFYVKLTTSSGRIVEAGTATADCLNITPPAGAGWGIVGAIGRSGSEVDQLAFLYTRY